MLYKLEKDVDLIAINRPLIREFGKDADSRISLNRTVIWHDDVGGLRFEEWTWTSIYDLLPDL